MSKSAEKGAGREGAREEGTQRRHAAKGAPPPAGRGRTTAALGRARPGQDVLSAVTPPRPLPSFTDSQPCPRSSSLTLFPSSLISRGVYEAAALDQTEFQALGAQRGATKGNGPHPTSPLRGQTTPEQPVCRGGESASSGRCWRESRGCPRVMETGEMFQAAEDSAGTLGCQLKPTQYLRLWLYLPPPREPLNRILHLCRGSKERRTERWGPSQTG